MNKKENKALKNGSLSDRIDQKKLECWDENAKSANDAEENQVMKALKRVDGKES